MSAASLSVPSVRLASPQGGEIPPRGEAIPCQGAACALWVGYNGPDGKPNGNGDCSFKVQPMATQACAESNNKLATAIADFIALARGRLS